MLFRQQYLPIIGFVALLWMPFDISSQPGRMHLLHAQEAVHGPDQSTSSDSTTNDFELSKITCLHIIRDDYEGLPLSYPCKVLVDSVKKEIYVADSGNSRILVYTHDFYPLLSIGKSAMVEVPVALAVDPEGYLFIAQSPTKKHKKGRISVLNPCLRWKKDIFFDGFEGADNFHPTNIAISNEGLLYVTGTAYRGVVALNKDGTFSHLLTPTDKLGNAPIEKPTICDVDIGNRGHIYLLSEDMGRIYVYDPDERFLFKFGQKGGGSGKLSRPRGMAVDSRNKRIYVIDYMRHTASAYSDDGRFLFEFGGKGWAKGWFQYPNDIAVDTAGNVLVADTFNNRVQVLGIEGASSVAKVEEAKHRVPVTEELVDQAEPGVPATEELAEQEPAKYYILTADMNLREKSNTDSKVIQLINRGEEFQIIDQYKHDELTSWYLIKTRSGLTGWLCGIYRGKAKFTEKER
jgi:DNA-binding beta-propeller fold protein YncE